MEYLALAGALHLTAKERSLHATGSDAKHFLDALPNRKARLQHAHKDHQFLLQSVNNSLHQGAPAPYSVRAHAKRCKPKKTDLIDSEKTGQPMTGGIKMLIALLVMQ